jgi:hypothetical protein
VSRAARSRSPIGRGAEQLIHVADRQHLGQRAPAFRPLDRRRRIVLAVPLGIKKPVELPDRREPPRDRCRRKPARRKRAEIAADVIVDGRRDRTALLAQVAGEILKIAPVGLERVRGRTALGGEHVEIEVDQPIVGILHANRPD